MKKLLKNACSYIELFSSLLIIGAVYIWAPVCDKLLTLESGKMVAMKCAHSAKTFVALAVIVAVCAFVSVLWKKSGRGIHLVVLACSILLILNTFTSFIGIGICMNPDMPCNITAMWVRICAGIMALASVVAMVYQEKRNRIPN
ncbi:MAG: DUF4418 family protein [Oscillospiraceae bacterium]